MVGDSPLVSFFRQAKHYHKGRRNKIDLVVIHDMESPKDVDRARKCAEYFATTGIEASAHYCVDDKTVVQCVREGDTGWHAKGANSNSIGIEHAGWAKYTAEEWADVYATAMLKVSARLAADIAKRHNIPVKFVDVDGLKRGERGITTHHALTLAFRKSTHTDPGPHFPVKQYMSWVKESSGKPEAGRNPSKAKAKPAPAAKAKPPATAAGTLHTVAPGETLSAIARKFKTNVATLKRLNPDLEDPSLIRPRQKLRVK